jgi:hypothetical protein
MRMLVLASTLLWFVCQDLGIDQEVRGPGHLQRNQTAAMRQFMKNTGFPKGRPGWVVDHVVPMCSGGPDAVPNMQWQTRQASYLKDVFERELCRAMKKQGLIVVKQEQR